MTSRRPSNQRVDRQRGKPNLRYMAGKYFRFIENHTHTNFNISVKEKCNLSRETQKQDVNTSNNISECAKQK